MIIKVRVATRIEAVPRNAYGFRVATNLLERAAKVICERGRWRLAPSACHLYSYLAFLIYSFITGLYNLLFLARYKSK